MIYTIANGSDVARFYCRDLGKVRVSLGNASVESNSDHHLSGVTPGHKHVLKIN